MLNGIKHLTPPLSRFFWSSFFDSDLRILDLRRPAFQRAPVRFEVSIEKGNGVSRNFWDSVFAKAQFRRPSRPTCKSFFTKFSGPLGFALLSVARGFNLVGLAQTVFLPGLFTLVR